MESNLNLNQKTEMEVTPLNFFSKLVKIFTNPREVMENILYYPKILIPMVYLSIITILNSLIILQLAPLTQQKLADIYMSKYGIDIYETIQNNSSTSLMNAFLSPIAIIIYWLIGGFFLWLLVKIFGGKSNIKQILSLYAHSFIISYTGVLLSSLIGLLLNTDINVFSLAIFMPNGDITSFTYNLMSLMQIFTIWATIIVGLGISVLNEFSKAKSMVIAFLHFILGSVLIAFMSVVPYIMLNLNK